MRSLRSSANEQVAQPLHLVVRELVQRVGVAAFDQDLDQPVCGCAGIRSISWKAQLLEIL
jgi:hypothetical protein